MKPGTVWTDKEISYLEENWGKKTYEQMSKNLGRSVEAIKLKGGRLKLGYRFHYSTNITFNTLLKALGIDISYAYTVERFTRMGFPFEYKKTEKKVYRMVNIDKFWKWAEENNSDLNFSKFEKGLLGPEPDWVDKKRNGDKTNPSKKNHNRPWTKKDDALLIQKVKSCKYTYKELSIDLKRTEGAIKRRLYDLGVPYRPIPLDNHTRWTQEEVDMMIELHQKGFDTHYIGNKLNKSQLSIKDRLKLYGECTAKKKYPNSGRKWSDEDLYFLKKNFNVLTHKEIEDTLKRSYYGIKAKAKRLGLIKVEGQ